VGGPRSEHLLDLGNAVLADQQQQQQQGRDVPC
jgi:hypothetical protein